MHMVLFYMHFPEIVFIFPKTTLEMFAESSHKWQSAAHHAVAVGGRRPTYLWTRRSEVPRRGQTRRKVRDRICERG